MNSRTRRFSFKTLVFVMILSFIFASFAYAETAVPVKTSFPDVSPAHWAVKYISKLSALGLVQGDDLGKYNPDDSVTQEQVITMAIRMMGLENEALQSATATILPFDVQNYAKPYVVMANNKKLLDLQEELSASLAGGSGSASWGAKKATREWVAKIVIRAVGKSDEAENKANTPTPFRDNQEISLSARGHINTAVSLGIVNGFEDGTFKPGGFVTRAQMAAFLSRAEKYLNNPLPRVVKGYVINSSDNKLTVQDKDGKLKQLDVNDQTLIFSAADEVKRVSASSLKSGFEVLAVQDNNAAYFIEVTNDQVRMENVEGTLVGLDLDKLTLTLTVNGQNANYSLLPNTSVVDKDGNGLSLSSLVKDSLLQIHRNAVIQDAKVEQIVVVRAPEIKKVEGLFSKIADNTLQVMNKSNGILEDYTLAQDAAVAYGDNANAGIDILYEGDTVTLQIIDGIAKSVKITNKAVDYIDTGKLYSLNLADKTIIIQKEKGLGAYLLSDQASVFIEGLPYAAFADLATGDQVKLEVKADKVVRVVVNNRNIKPTVLATIVGFEPATRILTVLDSFGKPVAYVMSDKTKIEYNNAMVAIKDFPDLFAKGKKVDMSVSDTNVLSIKLASKFAGKVTNKTANELNIVTSGNTAMAFKISSATSVEVANKPLASMNDVNVGDEVKITLNYSQEEIGTIAVEKSLMFKVGYKNDTDKRLTVVDQDGNSYEYTVDNSFTIERKGIAGTLAFEQIPLGSNLVISFTGKTIDKMTLLQTVLGKVTNVDIAKGKITLSKFDGAAEVVDLGKNFNIQNGSSVSAKLDAVKDNDRVEIIQGIDGSYLVNVIPSQKRVVSSYDAYSGTLVLLRRTLSDKSNYSFHPNAYTHKGAETFHPNYLLPNDEVTIYVLDDKIIELEK